MLTGMIGAMVMISALGMGSVTFMNFVNTYEISSKKKRGGVNELNSESLRERARTVR